MIIIFDFDGTIHKTELVYKKALHETLSEIGIDPKSVNYKKYIGMSPKDCWDDILKDDSDKDYLIAKNGKRIRENLKKYGALYENSYKTLEYLKEKYDLYILSKCLKAYMDEARQVFGLDDYFDKYLVGEDYNFIDKYKILRENVDYDYIMVGDREEDINAGFMNGKKTIFANYGYGNPNEGKNASYHIDDISELMKIL